MQKRLLFLGGSPFQLAPIRYARQAGHYIITCDYAPDNPGHQLADEYHNVSTTEFDAVLRLAKQSRVDGVVAYASDPAAPTQAYVANALDLPSNPFESVLTLARKDLFREFLSKNNFLTPQSASFQNFEEATPWFNSLGQPAMVKPVDSSGSKGVTKITSEIELEAAFQRALTYSRAKKVIIEEFFERTGYQVAGDGFVVDGKLAFHGWANEHFDRMCNPFVPIGESFPSIMTREEVSRAESETQRLLSLLNISTGALNFDFHFDKTGAFSFIELGPRNGGNLIPEVIRHATDVDLVKYTVDAALGLDCRTLSQIEPTGYYSSYMLHAVQSGQVRRVWISDDIRDNIVEQNIIVQPGDQVEKFDGSNHTLGTMILKFASEDEMLHKMDNMEEHILVEIA